MNKNYKVLYLLLFFPLVSFASEEPAIESTNFEVGGGYSSSKIFNSYSLAGTLNLPLSESFGAHITGMIRDSDGRRDGNTRGIGSKGQAILARLFFRNPSYTKLGIIAGYSHSKLDESLSSGDDTSDSEVYGIFGEYYLDNFSIMAARTNSSNDRDFETYVTELFGAWYFSDNTAIGLGQIRVVGEEDYGVVIAHQPSFMNNDMSFSVAYYSNSDSGKFDSLSVQLSYYFGTRVSLIERDRKYR